MPAKRKKAAKRKTPPGKKKKTTKTTRPAKRAPSRLRSRSKKQKRRWPAARLLTEARTRTRQIGLDAKPEVQRMLVALLDEAGWTRAQFVKVLVADVEARR
jgi:hypothetical protein